MFPSFPSNWDIHQIGLLDAKSDRASVNRKLVHSSRFVRWLLYINRKEWYQGDLCIEIVWKHAAKRIFTCRHSFCYSLIQHPKVGIEGVYRSLQTSTCRQKVRIKSNVCRTKFPQFSVAQPQFARLRVPTPAYCAAANTSGRGQLSRPRLQPLATYSDRYLRPYRPLALTAPQTHAVSLKKIFEGSLSAVSAPTFARKCLRLAALLKIYKICTLAHRSTLNMLAKQICLARSSCE